MMTIGRRYSGPKFNWRDTCDYCGVDWHRNELTLDENGFLSCPDDRAGKVDKELGYLNAQGAADMPLVRGKTRTK